MNPQILCQYTFVALKRVIIFRNFQRPLRTWSLSGVVVGLASETISRPRRLTLAQAAVTKPLSHNLVLASTKLHFQNFWERKVHHLHACIYFTVLKHLQSNFLTYSFRQIMDKVYGHFSLK